MPNVSDIFTFLLFLILLVLFIYVIVKSYINLSKKSGDAINNCESTVVSKRTEVFEDNNKKDKSMHFITFEINGDELELRVSPSEYKEISAHDEGILIYRGSTFLRFEIKNNGIDTKGIAD